MRIRLAVLAAVLCCGSYGCATPVDQPVGSAPAANATGTPPPAPRQTGSYRTGSRLPSYEEKGGASSVGDVSKDDYTDDMRRGVNPSFGR